MRGRSSGWNSGSGACRLSKPQFAVAAGSTVRAERGLAGSARSGGTHPQIPGKTKPVYNLGLAHLESQKSGSAVEAFQRALALDLRTRATGFMLARRFAPPARGCGDRKPCKCCAAAALSIWRFWCNWKGL